MNQRPYRVGDVVWVRQQARKSLPRGLRDGQQVTLLAFLPGHRLVQAEDGACFTVAMSHIRTELVEDSHGLASAAALAEWTGPRLLAA